MVALGIAAAIGCALTSGVFFAFSSFVMPALRRLPAHQGVTAMQAINVTAVTPAFMVALFGTAALCVATVIAGIRSWGDPADTLLVVGGAVFLIGTIATTIIVNVPRNDRLAALVPGAPASAAYWATFLREWTAANHVRTAAGFVAAVLLTLAVRSL